MSQLTESYQAIRIRVAESSLTETTQSLRRGTNKALRQAQRLIETELNRLPHSERGPVACRAGCDFCCHLRVMATPVEVFALLDYLEQTLDALALDSFKKRLVATEQRLRKLPAGKMLATNLPCPALVDGVCSGYAARPLNCRSYHSLSREACEDSFKHPEDLSRGHPELTAVAKVHEGGQAGFMAAFGQQGYDDRQYELVTALAEALDDPEAWSRFHRKETAFLRPSVLP